jgi:GTP-binding protein Era
VPQPAPNQRIRLEVVHEDGRVVVANKAPGLVTEPGRSHGSDTLLNALVGRKVSIVTPKPQTTRDPVQGVLHRPEGQIVFVDTPGFFKTHKSSLVDQLHQRARKALSGIDVVIHVVDPSREIGEEDEMVREVLAKVGQPRVLVINKADLPYEERPHRERWLEAARGYDAMAEVSGLMKQGLDALVEIILQRLPFGPPLYGETDTTNTTREFQIGELIREQIYLQMGDEIPYRTMVELDSFKEVKDPLGLPEFEINATIIASNERYKAMLIGQGGARIKQIRQFARRRLKEELGKPVRLDLEVLVDHKMAH